MDVATVQYIGVNHCGRDILVTEQFLQSANIIAILQQMCSEAVPPRKSYAHAVGLIGLFFIFFLSPPLFSPHRKRHAV